MDISHWYMDQRPFKRDGLTIIIRPGFVATKPEVYVYCDGRIMFGVRKIHLHADVKEIFPVIGFETNGVRFGDFVGDGYEQVGSYLKKGDLIISVKNFFHAANESFPAISSVLLQHLDTDNDCQFGGAVGLLQAVDFEAHIDGAKLALTYLDIHEPGVPGYLGEASSESLRRSPMRQIERFRELAFVEVRFRKSGIDLIPLEQ